jgi:hypothetical protein
MFDLISSGAMVTGRSTAATMRINRRVVDVDCRRAVSGEPRDQVECLTNFRFRPSLCENSREPHVMPIFIEFSNILSDQKCASR